MHEGAHLGLELAIALLAGAVLFVPLFKWLGLGSVLGYLFAGILLGPSIIGVTNEPHEIMEFAELGVVFLLFLIGLELNPQRLWALRRDIFGAGALQILLCGGLLMMYPLLIAGRSWEMALVAGLGLALSSTALVIQLIEERGAMRLRYGQKTFAVLLMQDIAIVPLLLVVALLAPAAADAAEMSTNEVALSVLKAVGAIGALILIGHYVVGPMFRIVARFGGTEIMTAAALLVVLGAGWAMIAVGLSAAMGAFLAGVLLAESNFQRELEADIQPFRGILLGLFFVSVGMSLDLRLITEYWWLVGGGVVTMVAVKTGVVYGLIRAFGSDHNTAIRSGLLLSQGGEFGFVLYTAAAAQGVMTNEDASLLSASVILSMVTTPFLIRFVMPRMLRKAAAKPEMSEDFDDANGEILIIGFGRYGQIVSQMMLAGGFQPTLLDNDAERVQDARRFGNRVFYGDGRRLDVLRAARAEYASLIAVCTSPGDTTTAIVTMVREQFPHARIYARAYDRRHALQLKARKVHYHRRETFDSAIRFGRDALMLLGVSPDDAMASEVTVKRRDRERLEFQEQEGLVEGHKKWMQVTPEPFVNLPSGAEADRAEPMDDDAAARARATRRRRQPAE